MPKRSIDDTNIILEPAETTDVSLTTSMLYANILRALFLEAARIARDSQGVHSPIVVRRLLRGAARIEAWRSGSPITADRFPPPQISPPASPDEPSPISDTDPDMDDSILAFKFMLSCGARGGCVGCNDPYRGCWEQLSREEQQQYRMQEQRND